MDTDNLISKGISLKSADGFFASLCTQIDKDMSEGRQILERPILELCKCIVKYLSNGGTLQLPAEFRMMAERVDNYWRYETKKGDIEREFSYSRVYQLADLVRIWEGEEQRDVAISLEAWRYSNNLSLLRTIYRSPGLTHKALSEYMQCSPSRLSQIIPPLVDNDYLLAQRIGSKKYYHLSGKGERLLTYMETAEKRRQRQTDEDKLFALLIEAGRISIESIQSKNTLREKIGNLSDEDLTKCLKGAQNRPSHKRSRKSHISSDPVANGDVHFEPTENSSNEVSQQSVGGADSTPQQARYIKSHRSCQEERYNNFRNGGNTVEVREGESSNNLLDRHKSILVKNINY